MNTDTKITTYLSTALIVGGFLLIALAWNGAASEFLVDKQLPFVVSGGLTGIGMIISGCTLALVQEMRKNAAELRGQVERLVAGSGPGGRRDALEDTLPEPRAHTGSSIERDGETVSS